ncbi:MAG TPA: patatin-like phospholipase family protein [Thermoanaerobaculia bacterium]|nr:patatin-like phospholipase family protein [Thermoanaerobaculia bacterium]
MANGDAGSRLSAERAAATPRIALALAGGGLEGAIYQIGALRAIDEALEGLDLNHLYIYVGVSSGGFLTACLANDLTPAQMCRAIVSHEPGEHPFVPETFLTPALRPLWQSARAVPRLLGEALLDYARNRQDRTLLGSLTRLSRALPVGVFDNEPIRAYLEKIYNLKSRTDDFRRLGKRLVIVAADLDSGQPVRFGISGTDHVPISRAVQASTALPGLYPPVEIDGRHYVDGILIKTLHASVALEAGAELVICINPIVPVDTVHAVELGLLPRSNLMDRGLPTVLSQTLRTIIHSRLKVGLESYRSKFSHADVILLEPERDDYVMFFTNIFGFSERRLVCEHAYRATRRYLRVHQNSLAPLLARHGISLRRDLLADEQRDLWQGVGLPTLAVPAAPPAPPPSGSEMVRRLDATLARLEELLAEQSAEPAETAEPPREGAEGEAAGAGWTGAQGSSLPAGSPQPPAAEL